MSVTSDSWESPSLHLAWTTFAEAFRAEASELRLPTRSFSVPSFLRFLIMGSPEHFKVESLSLADSAGSCDSRQSCAKPHEHVNFEDTTCAMPHECYIGPMPSPQCGSAAASQNFHRT